LRVWDRGPSFRAVAPRLALVGVILGVALMVRYVNGLMAPAIGATILLRAPQDRRVLLRAAAWGITIIPVVAVLVSIALWPRLWSEPRAHLEVSWAKLKGTHSGEPFLGTITNEPPLYYFLAYLGATAPVGVLVAMLGGIAAWIRERERRVSLAIAMIWLVVPLGVMFSPVRQDGVRYVIPCLLAIALLAGAGVSAVGGLLASRGRTRFAAWPLAVFGVYLVITCARIRPYYLDYYGEHVGGPASVAKSKRFEVAWWGEGVEEAIAYVNAHAAPGDRVHRNCVEPGHLTWFRGDLWEPVPDARAARWIVHYQPSWRPCPIPAGATRVYAVEAQGAPLAYVYRVGP
jgi:4-amino-4-deoxy-L-arabinose transferase-like glycosyltransferase